MWIQREKTFTYSGRRATYTTQVIDEPASGVEYGPEIPLDDVPTGGDSYVGGYASGPAGVTVEVSLDGGSSWDDLADGPVAVGGTPGVSQPIRARVVVPPLDGVTNQRATVVFGAEVGGQAGYAD